MKTKYLIVLACVLIMQACAHRPIIDLHKPGQEYSYKYDLEACERIAGRNTDHVSGTVTGAGLGAGLFALVGAVAGVDVGSMAKMGAALGAVHGLGNSAGGNRVMINNCLRGRGYSVIG